jgi:hypothetical protein
MSSSTFSLDIQVVDSDDSSADALDTATRSLRREMQDLGVDSVTSGRAGPAPAGSKSDAAVTVGQLAVVVLPVLVPKLMDLLQHWLGRNERRKIKVKTTIDGRTLEVQLPADLRGDPQVATLLQAAVKANASAKPSKRP